jgi:hypothetical protein
MITSYNPQEESSPSFKTVRFTVTDSDLIGIIEEIERREGREISDIGYEALIDAIMNYYDHY